MAFKNNEDESTMRGYCSEEKITDVKMARTTFKNEVCLFYSPPLKTL